MQYATVITDTSYPERIVGVFANPNDAKEYVEYLDANALVRGGYKVSSVPFFDDMGIYKYRYTEKVADDE